MLLMINFVRRQSEEKISGRHFSPEYSGCQLAVLEKQQPIMIQNYLIKKLKSNLYFY